MFGKRLGKMSKKQILIYAGIALALLAAAIVFKRLMLTRMIATVPADDDGTVIPFAMPIKSETD